MGTNHSGENVGPHSCRTSCLTHAPVPRNHILARETDPPAPPVPEQTALAPWTTANRRRHFLFSELRSERRRTARSRADRPPELRASLRFDITPIHATTHLPVSSCELQNWRFLLYIKQLQLTDCSFEPPWGVLRAIPSPQQDACTGPWGLVRVRKPETEEATMVKRTDFHNVSRIAGAVSARAPSGSASLTGLQIVYLPPARLRRSPNNARTHSKKQLKQIARSIERFGFVNPVLISDDFEIIAGHGRVEAAKILGLRQVPTVRLSNLSPADRRAYVITDNRLAELAGWDRELLASEFKGLLELQFDDIELTGFSLGEIDHMLDEAVEKKAEGPGPEDELPANGLQGPAVSTAGNLWVLGPHRLLCGDARDLTSYQFLLEGKQADLVLTDPPSNVAIEDNGSALDRVAHGLRIRSRLRPFSSSWR